MVVCYYSSKRNHLCTIIFKTAIKLHVEYFPMQYWYTVRDFNFVASFFLLFCPHHLQLLMLLVHCLIPANYPDNMLHIMKYISHHLMWKIFKNIFIISIHLKKKKQQLTTLGYIPLYQFRNHGNVYPHKITHSKC